MSDSQPESKVPVYLATERLGAEYGSDLWKRLLPLADDLNFLYASAIDLVPELSLDCFRSMETEFAKACAWATTLRQKIRTQAALKLEPRIYSGNEPARFYALVDHVAAGKMDVIAYYEDGRYGQYHRHGVSDPLISGAASYALKPEAPTPEWIYSYGKLC